MHAATIKVSVKNKITVPKPVLEKLNIKAGDHLLMNVQDDMLVLIPRPESYTDKLQGLHPDIWKSIDTNEYLNSERDAWVNSLVEFEQLP